MLPFLQSLKTQSTQIATFLSKTQTPKLVIPKLSVLSGGLSRWHSDFSTFPASCLQTTTIEESGLRLQNMRENTLISPTLDPRRASYSRQSSNSKSPTNSLQSTPIYMESPQPSFHPPLFNTGDKTTVACSEVVKLARKVCSF
jgi:hypothetical protein